MNSKMLFYILKRVLLALLTIWIVITVTFFVMHSIPGGPFASEKAISAEAQAALEAKYGLDKPLGEQYVTYLRDVVTKLDFGPSLKQRGRQVIDIILDGMKTSAKLGLIAAFSAAIAGIVLGALAALRRNTVLDKIIMVITTAFVSMPSFIMEHHFPALMQHHLGGYSIGGHDCGKQHECAEHTEHHQQEPDTTGQGLGAGAAGERNRRWHVGQYGLG